MSVPCLRFTATIIPWFCVIVTETYGALTAIPIDTGKLRTIMTKNIVLTVLCDFVGLFLDATTGVCETTEAAWPGAHTCSIIHSSCTYMLYHTLACSNITYLCCMMYIMLACAVAAGAHHLSHQH